MKNPHKLAEGQTLYFVPNTRGWAPYEITIVRLGRVWATTRRESSIGVIESPKISIENLVADGGKFASPGRAYLSREHYEHRQLRSALWLQIRTKLGWNPPPESELSTSRLREIVEELGLSSEVSK